MNGLAEVSRTAWPSSRRVGARTQPRPLCISSPAAAREPAAGRAYRGRDRSGHGSDRPQKREGGYRLPSEGLKGSSEVTDALHTEVKRHSPAPLLPAPCRLSPLSQSLHGVPTPLQQQRQGPIWGSGRTLPLLQGTALPALSSATHPLSPGSPGSAEPTPPTPAPPRAAAPLPAAPAASGFSSLTHIHGANALTLVSQHPEEPPSHRQHLLPHHRPPPPTMPGCSLLPGRACPVASTTPCRPERLRTPLGAPVAPSQSRTCPCNDLPGPAGV